MEKSSDFFEHWYNKYACMVLGGAMGLGAYNWIEWSKLTAADWGTWVGSVGTVGALIGTVWLATSERRKRLRDERAMEIVTCMSLLIRELKAMISIRTVLEELENDVPAISGVTMLQCSDILEQTELWTPQEVAPLIRVPNDAAAMLVHAVEAIRHTIGELRWMAMEGPEETAKRMSPLILQLRVALNALELAHVECEAVVHGPY